MGRPEDRVGVGARCGILEDGGGRLEHRQLYKGSKLLCHWLMQPVERFMSGQRPVISMQ